ncbi:MAG: cytochrome P450 [Salinibacterium sp.]|nr:cytochrome P450 [Salinibacterium sp.]
MVSAKQTDDWDPRGPGALADPTQAYDAMRGTCPVAHSEYLGWSVFRHSDVVAVVEDHASYSSRVSARHPAVPNGYDPPQHGRYRDLVDHYFHPDDVNTFEPLFSSIASELAAELPGDGSEIEFIDRFALTYALQTQRAWLGWPDYFAVALREWVTRQHSATLSGDRQALADVARDFDGVVSRVLAEWRARPSPADDITSRLLREQIDGVPLSDDEIVSILRNWTVGELATMSASVGILVDYLARHPQLQERLRHAPEDLPAAIDEILRIHAPLSSNRRVTTRAVELGGRYIDAGERITISWASANRDEAVFGDPDEYRPHENAPHNLLYGRGIHDCPGAPLARLELRVAIAELLAATRQIALSLDTPPVVAAYPASGFRTLPVHIFR